jgi:hypothetical protein
MKESAERVIKLGFRRNPKIIFDEVELVSAEMVRQGWGLKDTLIEEGLGNIHLFFEREIETLPGSDVSNEAN